MKLKPKFFIFLAVILNIAVYYRWFTFSIFQSGDWSFNFYEGLKELSVLPVWIGNQGFGMIDLTFWKLPINLIYSLFGYFNYDSNIADFFIVYFPIIFLIPIGSYYLVKKISRSDIGALVGSLVFSFNTYFLSITTQGHIMINAAVSFCIVSIYLFIDGPNNKSRSSNYILSILFLFISTFFDFRISYITAVILFLYFMFCTDFKNGFYLRVKTGIYLFLFFISLNFYWLLPQFISGSLMSNQVLGRSLFGNQYWSIENALCLVHPFWTGNLIEWFTIQEIKWYFWLAPLFAFLGLLFNKKNKNVLFFGFVSLLGIFLTKQVSEPFPGAYPWLYKNFPGFGAFREASKFYFLIILGYTVLIGSLVAYFWQIKVIFKNKNSPKYIILLATSMLFLWNTKPVVTGDLGTMLIPRSIPVDYVNFKSFLEKDKEYYRTLWIPRDSRWGLRTNNHPKVNTADILPSAFANILSQSPGMSPEEMILRVINEPLSRTLLSISQVRYVVVPIQDIENNDDFFKFYGGKENPNIRQWYIEKLNRVTWLNRVNVGTEDLVVYENEGYKTPVFSFLKLYNFDSLQNLDNKYFFTNNIGDNFYFVSSSTDKAIIPLVKISSLFENTTLRNGTIVDNIDNGREKTKLFINLNISNLKNNLYLNNKHVSSGNVKLDQSVNVFEYKNPEYKFENIIQNPSVENGLWQEKVGDCNNFDKNPLIGMSLNKETKSDGVQSLQLEATRHIACTAIGLNVVADSTYQFSFDYQSPNADHAAYYLGFNDKNKTIINEDLPIKNKDWNTFSKTFKVPEGATSVSLYVYADSTDGKTNIINRYDNFKLIQVPDLSNAYYLVSDPGIKFVEPKSITFDLINPTKKIVHIKGATTPFYLAMSESFHQQWQLQFNNSKINGFFYSWVPFIKPDRISDEYHYKLNDFLNAWYVDVDQYCRNGNMCTRNVDGSYDMEMVIEFFPQRWFYLGLLISGTTLVGCVGYLGYEGVQAIKRRRKNKHEKDN